ncbi:nuclear transcription factor Y subunit A-9-like protein [Tanacetum coccineum]
MCILIVPQQNTGFILDSDMEGKNEESYKFPIAVQQSFNSLWSQDVRGDPDSGIGGHWRSSDSGMYKFILILRALAVFRFRRALAVFRFRHAFTKNGIACIYLEAIFLELLGHVNTIGLSLKFTPYIVNGRYTLLAYFSNSMATTAMRLADSGDSTSQEQSLNKDSQSDDVLSEEEDDVSKETHNMAYIGSDSYGQGQQNFQNGATNILPRNEETISQAPQPELVACAPNPYYDPYYGGMMAAYGQHMGTPCCNILATPWPTTAMRASRFRLPEGEWPLGLSGIEGPISLEVHPQFLDMHQVRMPLPLEMAQEPVYVNAKQYHAILRRRQSRAKAELEKKLIKDRKPYLHESRHQHAMRRMRSSGGRFAKKTESEKNSTSSSSSGMKRVNSESTESINTHQETSGDMVNSCNGHTYEETRGSMVTSLGQQWSTMPSNNATPQRAVAMK